jgi:hypothetical protein
MTTIESFLNGNRTATLSTEAGVVTLDCFENDILVRGQCFSSNPLSYGPERAADAAQRWVNRR